VDIADAAVAAMSGGTSQPNVNAIVAALKNTPRDTGLDQATLNECSDYWETVRTYYLPFDSGPKSGNARLYEHEIPGGQYTNLREQAVSMGLSHRWREVERMYAEVNQLFGDIVKVTPSSKVGEPNLSEETVKSAPAMVNELTNQINGVQPSQEVGVQAIKTGTGTPGANEAAPTSKRASAASTNGQAMDGQAPTPAPAQVNEIQKSGTGTQVASAEQPAPVDPKQESSSKKKGKKGLRKLIPF
jgi:pyruvate carboxylase